MSVNILIGLLLALGCAVTTNVASVLKHRGANLAPAFCVTRPLQSTRALMRSRWFAAGLGLAQVAGVLHIAAITLAPMSVVQVVMAGGVVLVAALAKRLLGAHAPRRQRLGLWAAGAGLALLVLSAPQLHGAHSAFAAPTLLLFEVALTVLGLALAAGLRLARLVPHRGVLLSVSGGAIFGVSDVAIKAVTGLSGHGGSVAALVVVLAVAIVTGIAAQVLSIRALQEGEAVQVIALTGVAGSVANIAGGFVVFGDPMAHGTLAWIAQSTAFTLVLFGSARMPSSSRETRGAGSGTLALGVA